MLPCTKLDMHDIFKCVTYLAPLKCECTVGGATNRQIQFSKKKMCGQLPIHQSLLAGGNTLLRRISS